MTTFVHHDPRDMQVRTVFGQIDGLGILCLIVLDRLFPEKVALDRIAFMFKIGDVRKTLQPILNTLETFSFASRSGSKAHEQWIITDLGRFTLQHISRHATSTDFHDWLPSQSDSQPALPLPKGGEIVDNSAGEILSQPSSSSSDLLDLDQNLDQIRSEEEEKPEKISEADRQAGVEAWCQQWSVTGAYKQDVLDDSWCTVKRLEGWRSEIARRESVGSFKPRNKKGGALVYALRCCLNPLHDEPPDPWAAHAVNRRRVEVEVESEPESKKISESADEAEPVVEAPAPPAVPTGFVRPAQTVAEIDQALRDQVRRSNATWLELYGSAFFVRNLDAAGTLTLEVHRDYLPAFQRAQARLLELAQTVAEVCDLVFIEVKN